jgi:acetyl esterase/lipase
MSRRRIVSLARAAVALSPVLTARCTPVEALNATVDTSGLRVTRDVPFAAGPRGMMDVYRPDSDALLPVVVFFYGGAWQSGRRQDFVFVAADLARRGFVVVVPDYRLYPEVPFPVFLEDAAVATAAVQARAAEWGGDAGHVFVSGHSAGAWLATMLALDPRWLAAAGGGRDRLAGVVGIAGPYDFLPITGADIKAVFSAAAEPRDSQPIAFVDGRNPPMLLLHGADDDTCYPRNSLALAARVTAAGGPARVKIYPDVGHIGIVLGFAAMFRTWSPVLDDVAGFASPA